LITRVMAEILCDKVSVDAQMCMIGWSVNV
jgi:hypothetical protein